MMNSSFRPSIASSMGNVGDIVEIEKVKGKKKLKSALSANLLKNKKLKNFKNKIIKTIQVSSSEDEDDNDESVGIEVAYVDERSSSKTENDKESEIVGENELENVENENHDDGNEKIINYDEDIRSKISQKSINKTDVDADDELDDSSSDSFDAGPQSRVKVRDLNKKLRSNAFPILDMFTTPKSEKDEMDIVNSDIASSDDSEKIIEKEIPTNDLGDSERVREEYEQLKKKYLRFSAEDQKRKSLKNKGKKVEEEEEEETEDDIEANNDQNGDLITNVTDYFTNMINAPIQLFSSLFTGEETNKTNIEEIKEKEEEEEEEEEEKKSDVEIEENSSVEGKRIKKKKRMKKKMKKLEEEHRKKYEKRLMRQSLKKVRKWKRDQPNKIVRRCYSSFTAPTTLQRFTVYIKSRSESVCHSQKYCECSSQLKTKKVVIEDSPTSIIDVSFSEIGETHKRNTFRYNGAKWNLFKNAIAAVRRDGENDYDISLSSSFGRKSNGKLSVKQILEFSNDEKMRVLGNLDVKKLSKLHNSSIVVAKTCHLEDIIDDPKLEDLSDRSSEIRSTGQRYDDDDVMESPKSESERDEKMLDKLKSFAMHENASTGSPVPQSKRKYSGLSINNKFVENVCGGKLYVCLESIHVQLLRCRHRILKKLNGSSEEEYDGPEFDSDLSYGEDIPGSQRKKKKKKKRKRFHSKKTRKLAMRRYGIDPTTIYRDRDGKTKTDKSEKKFEKEEKSDDGRKSLLGNLFSNISTSSSTTQFTTPTTITTTTIATISTTITSIAPPTTTTVGGITMTTNFRSNNNTKQTNILPNIVKGDNENLEKVNLFKSEEKKPTSLISMKDGKSNLPKEKMTNKYEKLSLENKETSSKTYELDDGANFLSGIRNMIEEGTKKMENENSSQQNSPLKMLRNKSEQFSMNRTSSVLDKLSRKNEELSKTFSSRFSVFDSLSKLTGNDNENNEISHSSSLITTTTTTTTTTTITPTTSIVSEMSSTNSLLGLNSSTNIFNTLANKATSLASILKPDGIDTLINSTIIDPATPTMGFGWENELMDDMDELNDVYSSPQINSDNEEVHFNYMNNNYNQMNKKSNKKFTEYFDPLEELTDAIKGRLQVKIEAKEYELRVWVMGAVSLPKSAVSGMMLDVFCRITLFSERKLLSSRKTKTLKQTCDPVWNQKFAFSPIPEKDVESTEINFAVWDTKLSEENPSKIGCAQIPLKIFTSAPIDAGALWLDLVDKSSPKSKSSGNIDGKKELSLSSSLSESSDEVEEDTKELNAKSLNSADQFLQRLNELKLKLSSKNSITTTTTNVQDTLTTTTITTTETSKLVTSILTQSADKRIGNLLNSSPSISKNSSTISSISFPKPKENIILPSTISNDQKMDDKFHQKRIDVTSHLSEKKFENLNERKFDNFKILNLSTQKMKFEPKSTEIIKSSKVNEEEKRKKYLANLAKFDYGDDEELLEMNFNSAPTSIPTPSDISKDEIDERSQLLEKLMNNKSNEFFKKLEGQNDQFRFDLNKPLPIKIRINENLEKSFQNETTKNFMRKNTPNVMNIPNLDDDIIRSWNRYFYKDLYSKQTDLIRYENESICPSSLLEPSTSNKETQSNLQSFSVETTKYEIEREPDPIPIKIIEEKEDEIKKEIIKPIEPVPVEVVVEEISEPPVIPTTSKVRPNISSKRPSNSSSKADLISRSSIESNQEPVKQSVTKVPVIRKVVKKSMSTTKPINSGKQVEKKVQENKLVQKSSHTTTNIKGILSTSNGSIASKGKPRQEIKRTEIGNRKKDLSKKNVVGNSQQQLDNISINSKTGINRTKMRRIPKGNGTSFSKEVSNDTISMTSLKSNKQKKTVEVRKKTPIDNKRKYGKNIRQFSKHESNSSLDQTNNLVDTSLPSTIIGNVTSKSVNVTKAPRLLSPYPHVQTCSSNVVSSEFFTSPTTTTTTPTTILSNISIGLEKKSNNDVTSTSIAMQRKEFNQFMSETYSNKKPIPIITEKMTSTTTAAYFRPIKFNELTPRNSEDTLLEGSVDTSKSTSSKSTLPILQTNQQPNIGNILTNPIQPPQLIGQKPNEQQYGNVSQQNMISMQMTNSTIVPPSSMINKFVPTPNLNTTTMITTTTTMKISNMNNYPEIFPANMSMNENIQTNQYQLTNNQKMNNVPMTMMMMTTTTNLPQNIVNSFQQMSAPSPAVVVATTMNVQTGGHIAKPTLSRRRSRKEMMETYDKICKYQPPSIKNKSNVILPKAPLGFKTLNPYTGRSKAHPHVIKTHPYELHTSDDFCIEDLLLNNELTLKHQTSLSRSNTHSAIFDKDNNVWGDSTNVTSSKLIEDIKVFKEKHRNKVRLREQQQKQQANVKGMGGNMMRHRMTPNHLGGKRKDQMLNATRRSSQKSNVISLALNEKQIMENQELVENINIPAAVPGEGDAGLIKAGILGGHDPLRQKKLRAHRELKVQQQIQAQKKLQMIHSQSESLAKSKKLGAQKSMDKNAMIEADPFGQIVPDPKSRNKHKGKNAAGLDGPDNMIRPITSTTNTQIGAVTGYLSDTAATATSTAPNTKGKRRTSVAKALVILGINKKSQSASNLGQRRLGFNRTEEIGIPDKLMSRSLSRTTSQSSEGSDISSILKDAMLREDESVTEFVDGLGPGQIISRQALASPCLGKIQLKFIESGLPPTQLRCEIVRAKDMALKPSIKQLPIITAKLYLFDGKNCTEKLKATANERTTEPSFRYGHDFVDTDWRYRVLHIAITGDYGKLDRNSFMGVAQVLMNDLAVDLNSNVKKTLLSWFPLFTQSSLVAVPNFSTTAPGAMGSALNSAITGGGTTVGISSSNSTVGFGRMNNKNAKKHLRRTAMEIEQEKNDKIANDINLQTEFAKSSKVANML